MVKNVLKTALLLNSNDYRQDHFEVIQYKLNCRMAAQSLPHERSDTMVTYETLFTFGLLIVAIITLCLLVSKDKDK